MKKIIRSGIDSMRNHKIITAVVVVAIIAIAGFVFIGADGEPETEFMTVGLTEVSQEIDVTGRVEPTEKVELTIQSGGKVSSIAAKVGNKVTVGQTLLRVNAEDLDVLLRRQRADLEKSKIALAKLEFKTGSEDDLEKAYEDGFNAISNVFVDLPEIVTGLRQILGESYLSSNIGSRFGSRALEFRTVAQTDYYAAKNQYGDVLKEYRLASRDSGEETIDSLILDTYEMVQTVSDSVKTMNNFVDYVEDRLDDSAENNPQLAEDQESLDSYTGELNTHLAALLEIKDIIKDSKEGITDEDQDVESLNLDIQQARLDIEDTQVQIGRRIIRSPINGVVTDVSVEVGETITANEPVISIISSNQFQIEANLPEADIAKVTVGSPAEITLDAYGDDVVFIATVVLIDPAETIVDGVATYKITLEFSEVDPRIKSGMTADIIIQGEKRENVLAVPQRAVISGDDRKYVRVMEGEVVVEKEVTTGLRGSDGNVEILSGLSEGDQVIVFSETE